MSNPIRVFIANANPEFTNYPNSISFNYEGQSMILNFNQVELNTCYFTVSLKDFSFIAFFTASPEILVSLGCFDKNAQDLLSLDFLVSRTSLAVDVLDGWPVYLEFFSLEQEPQPLLALKLEWLSHNMQLAMHFKTDLKADACVQETSNLRKSIAAKAEISQVLDLNSKFDILSLKFYSYDQLLVDRMLQMKAIQDSSIEKFHVSYDKKLIEIQTKYEELSAKYMIQETEMHELKITSQMLACQLSEHEINMPTYGEIDQIDGRISVLETIVSDLNQNKVAKVVRKISFESKTLKIENNHSKVDSERSMNNSLSSLCDSDITDEISNSLVLRKNSSLINEVTARISRNNQESNYNFSPSFLYLDDNSMEEDANAEAEATLNLLEMDYSKLTALNFVGSNIGDNGVRSISNSLKNNSTPTLLYLENNRIGEAEVKEIANALGTNFTLTTLDIRFNTFGVVGAQAIANALDANYTLTVLYLEYNNIGDNGAKAIAYALETNSTLTSLYLENNLIGEVGVRAIANALKINSTLIVLDLADNSINDSGAKSVANALETNDTLTVLDLIGNNIGDDGVVAISNSLQYNSSLTRLYITSNFFGKAGAEAIVKAQETKATLIDVYLH